MTDDIDIGAVRRTHSRKAAFIEALAAGHDLIMIKNLFGFDPLLPQNAQRWVRRAIRKGQISKDQVIDAAQRVRMLDAYARTMPKGPEPDDAGKTG